VQERNFQSFDKILQNNLQGFENHVQIPVECIAFYGSLKRAQGPAIFYKWGNEDANLRLHQKSPI